ncbi:glycosyltransferase family 39 protein [Mucilaginibacter roseus]|uniref:Glycosyltransferase family 39 protein n=1 Tax=Mucilaginibacter roseus TaxID=1528868 RepID=A0ABS8TWZ8_9SPHI|nr:glycosyltransferase family 39 protein [Mucilaginibacter roseus]MCD8739408.1 glycosyltransferase family 39 protein [Mucilaginibacter roseus]
MIYRNKRAEYHKFVLIFVLVKVALNLLAISNFGFHRDELLHLSLADHLDWGFKEVPPFIALLAKISLGLFGDSVFASRLFTTIASGIIIWLTGMITIELGGRKFAIAIACLSMIFAPAFAASGYLFQPVVFDQLWWVLAAWCIVKYVNTSSVIFLYGFGLTTGVGMLTKYTMAFFAVALVLSVLISRQRKLLFTKHTLGAALLALIVFLPNLIWQWQHNFPVLHHMSELRETQLEYIKAGDFIAQQLMVNGIALFVWLTGFVFLLVSFRLRKYQFLAFAYILIFIFLVQMNGKSYYLFGAYPMLFAAGGCGFDRLFKTAGNPLRAVAIVMVTLPNVILLPTVLPVLPLQQTVKAISFTKSMVPALDFLTRWEDQQQHATTQDYADMLGWDEMAKLTAKAYHGLSDQAKTQTRIFAENYGQAGAITVYGKRFNIPQVISLSSSFSLWAPDSLVPKYLIYIAENEDGVKELQPFIERYVKIGTINNPLAREKGSGVYLLYNPQPSLNQRYQKELAELRK